MELGKKPMHEPVVNRLEEILNGEGPFDEVESHLKHCAPCRKEMEAMRMQSALFRSLRAPREVDPDGAFYARVMNRIDTQPKPSVWNLFGESLFAKRLAYASAVFLVAMGSVLVKAEQEEPLAVAAPEYIFAGEAHPAPVSMEDTQRDRDDILVKLATYQEPQ